MRQTVCLGEVLERLGLGSAFSVQSNGMSAYLFLRQADGEEHLPELEAFLRQHLAELGASKLYGPRELAAMGAVAGVSLAVEAAPGVVFEDGLPQAKREKATHGFGPGHPAENCLFALRGPGIKEGVWLTDMPMRDVAPTLAGLLGVELPQAQGVDHSLSLIHI